MNYAGQFNAQDLDTWTSEWGGGSLPKPQHGSALFGPGLATYMSPGGSGDTYYQVQRMAAANAAQVVDYHVSYIVPDAASLALCQALEFEIQRNDGHQILNGGVQFDIKGSRRVRTYDFSAGHWVPTTIPCDDSLLLGGKLLDVVAVYDLTPNTITYRGLCINGVWVALGITRPSKVEQQTAYLNYAFQFDFTSGVSPAILLTPAIDIVVT